jgi:hypothetical protein
VEDNVRNTAFAALLIGLLAITSCARVKQPALQPTPGVPGASLWRQPADLQAQDLFYGPWSREDAPDPNATYTLVELKHTGVNPGMTVRDPKGREWSVKLANPGGLDEEHRVEVVLSRLLSAAGYHQPPVYFLPAFSLQTDVGTRAVAGGRFRLQQESLKDRGAWSWQENPFVRTRPYRGMLVLLMMFNSTDLKNSNTTVYEHRLDGRVEHWYVVRDLGAALGDTDRFAPRKGDVAAFERHPYILGVSNGHVDFAYRGWYDKLVEDRITPADVAWASNLLAPLRENQWRDAFRAGGYSPAVAARFIRKLREKIDQGRALPS